MNAQHETPGALLALFMRRRGWSAARLAEIAGDVSASSVRSYCADRSTPRPQQALAVAHAMGPIEGRALLDAWGYTDLADGFESQFQESTTGRPQVDVSKEAVSSAGQDLMHALASWIRHVESKKDSPE